MHNVKSDFSESVRRLLRPLVKIMMREGITYSDFARIARMAFVESSTFDFGSVGTKTPASAVCALAGISFKELVNTLDEMDQFDASQASTIGNPYAAVLHGWYNDREYVGPYGFPADIPFVGEGPSLESLVKRHGKGIAPEAVLQELIRLQIVKEVGPNIWAPLKQEYIDSSLSPENLRRMAILVASLIATLEINTASKSNPGNEVDLFERTMFVADPLTHSQLRALQEYLKDSGGLFLQRADAFSSVDLRKQKFSKVDEAADKRAGLEIFLYVEPTDSPVLVRTNIDFAN